MWIFCNPSSDWGSGGLGFSEADFAKLTIPKMQNYLRAASKKGGPKPHPRVEKLKLEREAKDGEQATRDMVASLMMVAQNKNISKEASDERRTESKADI